jgi:hypothetical protein
MQKADLADKNAQKTENSAPEKKISAASVQPVCWDAPANVLRTGAVASVWNDLARCQICLCRLRSLSGSARSSSLPTAKPGSLDVASGGRSVYFG